MQQKQPPALGLFERYLSLWVILCIAIGIMLGQFFPTFAAALGKLEYARISLPIAVLIWLMIYPMMLKVDFPGIVRALTMPKGLAITTTTNWLIKPFTMYAISWFFFFILFQNIIPTPLAKEYLAGAVLLGAAPCTAMVLVWSQLTKGDPAYTLVQVAVNDLLVLFAYAPIVALLLGVGGIKIPLDTLLLSVVLFVVIPLAAGWITRSQYLKQKGPQAFNAFVKKFEPFTMVGLLLTLIIIFSFQGETILQNPLHIALIAIPFTLQTLFVFALSYGAAQRLRLPHAIAAPAGMIGASNFFELSVAVAIALFGIDSGAALATTVGLLTEVPLMLFLVRIANQTRHWFPSSASTK